MYRAIFLDFGNTLVGFKPAFYEKLQIILKEHGYDVEIRKVFRAYVKAMAINNYAQPTDIKEFLYNLSIPPDEKLINSIMSSDIRDGEAFVYDEVIEFLETIRSANLKLILVSNSSPRTKKLLEELGLVKYFDNLVLSHEIGIVKPNPKIFAIAISKGGYPALHIGDIYEIDYIGARRSYLDAVLLDRYDFYPEIKEKVRDLREIIPTIMKNL
ncbi:HAD family hydrolase [Saccharolobus solfataricus]|uniref:2-haloalkanoic acid dehalogenase n=3 Tax=Saccharolobus solfataricus TaxID=2287 RepID=Q97X58_SACS2|nr:HAD family hydrolase [Saccharolobus solfataricus]AAK42086.1 2-haloalkanoic acid dehalogenase [Saccharolobus solfataricus P2]AKA74787.1 HAD family hydrolase [Saccharolobus solfataricus]AKA77483.1 HAD family hydrolase [Saccharolobus solfataricus]AKA80173.1 HAD family hydrolase [Saccharolobus solfataricus]AZF69255.1 HAD family hydrolase [Saccharolobus solfataricus]